ncbi:MAG: hypothetical protein ABUL45_00095, partial [Rhodanobacter sp.]
MQLISMREAYLWRRMAEADAAGGMCGLQASASRAACAILPTGTAACIRLQRKTIPVPSACRR